MEALIYFPFLNPLSRSMGSFDFSAISPEPTCITPPELGDKVVEHAAKAAMPNVKNELPEALWANDGVVPLFSQWHPHECR